MKKILFVLCLGLVSVGYSQCVEGDCENGTGTYIYAYNRSKYVGEFKNNKMHGQGTFTMGDGSKYIGEYKDDMMHGEGTITFANGEEKYVGEFKNSNMHGQGTFTNADGTIYHKGLWENGKPVK